MGTGWGKALWCRVYSINYFGYARVIWVFFEFQRVQQEYQETTPDLHRLLRCCFSWLMIQHPVELISSACVLCQAATMTWHATWDLHRIAQHCTLQIFIDSLHAWQIWTDVFKIEKQLLEVKAIALRRCRANKQERFAMLHWTWRFGWSWNMNRAMSLPYSAR